MNHIINITNIRDIDYLIYEYLEDINILENLEELVKESVHQCCVDEFHDDDEYGDLPCRKVADMYENTFTETIRPIIDEYLEDIYTDMKEFENNGNSYINDFIVMDECIYYAILDHQWNICSDFFGICVDCGVFLTSEYTRSGEYYYDEDILCINCYSNENDGDESSESDIHSSD